VSFVEIRGASKAYAGQLAIDKVDFDVELGEVHSLVGENGAGKSTLCKSLAGAVVLSSGTITIGGKEMKFETPKDALDAGVVMVYQETSLVPTMTVAQNIQLGKEKALNRLRGLYIWGQQLLHSLNFHVDPTALVSSLGAAQKQMVEIARAVFHEAKVIIFDEPTATLTPEEKQHFFDLVANLKARGTAIIFISHALEEALETSDRITVLRDGKNVITAPAREFTRAKLVQSMVGRAVTAVERKPRKPVGEKRKVLVVENLSQGTMVKNMSFSVYAGEVTGMSGLVGSGRTETAKVIAGATKRNLMHGGMVYLDGKAVRYRVPRQAVDDGIVYVTEDRKLNGFYETMSVGENIYLSWLASKDGRGLFVSKGQQRKIADKWKDRLSIRSVSKDPRINELSGGNQQKVVIAKSLVQKPKVVIFDEPTRGVDVGSIQEIHEFIRSLAEEDIAVIVISSYLPEVLAISDRILVTRAGRVVEEFTLENATEEKIMYAAVH
jgi:ABC-type sugar transport system ATPase subunit